MSKMDRIINSKVDQQSIYEIYRSCRLCGAGAGYKMPIIQNVLDVDGEEVQLKHKIQDCIRIEVHQDDKMPPLICEVCVDKVNDFYEFMELCRKTNKRTRQRLGLPVETVAKGKPEAGDCILGVTEPVYLKEKEEPQTRSSVRKVQIKVPEKDRPKSKKPEVKVKVEKEKERAKERERERAKERERERRVRESRSARRRRSPSPPPARVTRHSLEEAVPLNRLKIKTRNSASATAPKTQSAPLKSILKKPTKVEDTSPTLRSKRTKEPPKPEVPEKKVKLVAKPPQKPPPTPPPIRCPICREHYKNPQGMASHVKTHTATYTSIEQSCAACREWFPTAAAAAGHHDRHRSYRCRWCRRSHATHDKLLLHIKKEECSPWTVVPDLKCEECWLTFPTKPLLDDHRCQGVDRRPGGKCSKCSRVYALRKNLMKHELTCSYKPKEFVIDPALRKKLKPFQVRLSKCDSLLNRRGRCSAFDVPKDHGLDSSRIYPYFTSAALNRDRMVKIISPLDDLYCEADYVHWDSEISDDEATERMAQVYSLSNLCLKTLFSLKCLGRVPRKRRKIKTEQEIFDSLPNNDDEGNLSTDIGKIIDNLGEDIDEKDSTNASSRDTTKDGNDSAENIENDKTSDGIESDAGNASNEVAENSLSENEGRKGEGGAMGNDEESLNQNSTKGDEVENAVSNDIPDALIDNKDSCKISDDSKENINDTTSHTEAKSDKDKEVSNVEIQGNDTESASNSGHNDENDKQRKQHNTENISTENEKDNAAVKEVIDNKEECKESDADNLSEKRSESESIENKESNIKCKSIDEEKYEDSESIDKKESNSLDTHNINDELNNVNKNKDDSRTENEHADANSDEKQSNILEKEKEENISERDNDISNDVENQRNTESVVNKSENTENKRDSLVDKNHTLKKNGTTVNGDIDETSDKLNMEDFKDTSDAYIDDKKLMDALNEHIGENSDKSDTDGRDDANNDESVCNNSITKVGVDGGKVSDCVNTNDSASDSQTKSAVDTDKTGLGDPATKKLDQSMDLDSISEDEFDFD